MTLKAYVVTDDMGEGHAEVVFSDKSVVARREGANALDCEFGEVSCMRAPWADHLAPGPASAKDCIELGGLNYECACGCGRRIDSAEGYSIYDDDAVNPMEPVYIGLSKVYWNHRCKDNDDRYRQELKDKAARDQFEAEAAVLAKWPFATDIHAFRRPAGRGDALCASFKFPGGEWPVSWAIGAEAIYAPQGEVEAWNALTAPAGASA